MNASDGDMTVTVKHRRSVVVEIFTATVMIVLCAVCALVGWAGGVRDGYRDGQVAGKAAGVTSVPNDRWTRFRLSGGAQVAVDPDGTIEAHCPDNGFILKDLGKPFTGRPPQ